MKQKLGFHENESCHLGDICEISKFDMLCKQETVMNYFWLVSKTSQDMTESSYTEISTQIKMYNVGSIRFLIKS